jgi:hypothetical protein
MAYVLWQQRCLEVDSRLHHVGVVDETRRTYRHHGRQRDAPRRIATFRHATLRVAPHRYATLEPLGKPGGSRAFSADGPPSSASGSETTNLRTSAMALAPGSVRFSQKSYKVAVRLGTTLVPRAFAPGQTGRRERWLAVPRPLELSSGGAKFLPEASWTYAQFAPVNVTPTLLLACSYLAPRDNQAQKMRGNALKLTGAAHGT